MDHWECMHWWHILEFHSHTSIHCVGIYIYVSLGVYPNDIFIEAYMCRQVHPDEFNMDGLMGIYGYIRMDKYFLMTLYGCHSI